MTNLTKPVRRVTGAVYRTRNIVIEMRPPSLLAARLKGTKTWYTVDAMSVYMLAVKIEAAAQVKARKEARRQRALERRQGK